MLWPTPRKRNSISSARTPIRRSIREALYNSLGEAYLKTKSPLLAATGIREGARR